MAQPPKKPKLIRPSTWYKPGPERALKLQTQTPRRQIRDVQGVLCQNMKTKKVRSGQSQKP